MPLLPSLPAPLLPAATGAARPLGPCWWLAAALLLLAAGQSLSGSPAARDVAPLLAPALVWTAALLALAATPLAWRPPRQGEPAATPEDPPRAPREDLLEDLRHLLSEERRQMREATALLSRAVAAGAQLSGLTQAAGNRLRVMLEAEAAPAARLPALSPLPSPSPDPSADPSENPSLAPRLEAALHRLEAALPAEALSRVEACAAQLGTAAPALSRLPEVLAALLAQQSGLARGEARLGDAARYLTDTTDRLAGEAALLESQAVRLQAMISILGREGRLSG
ncbi:hypothetical protein [Pseudoroseomonas sp. WGS1072]|uniref:hypothetical protein n=1 Tax=Roseomonas sp. WGS1072 TaxID=3366816 RepID=UPI003BF0D1B6